MKNKVLSLPHNILKNIAAIVPHFYLTKELNYEDHMFINCAFVISTVLFLYFLLGRYQRTTSKHVRVQARPSVFVCVFETQRLHQTFKAVCAASMQRLN